MPELRLLSAGLRERFQRQVKRGAIRPVETDLNQSWMPRSLLSAAAYLRICRICYAAVGDFDRGADDEKLYRSFADGRHGGLLALPRTSRAAFIEWLSSGATAGSHPWEIVRDRVILSVHGEQTGKYWLRLATRHEDVSPQLIAMAVRLCRSGIPFRMRSLADHVRFAKGGDWVGVADSAVWERGVPFWPVGGGILNAPQSGFSTEELAPFPELVRKIRWFAEPPRVRALF